MFVCLEAMPLLGTKWCSVSRPKNFPLVFLIWKWVTPEAPVTTPPTKVQSAMEMQISFRVSYIYHGLCAASKCTIPKALWRKHSLNCVVVCVCFNGDSQKELSWFGTVERELCVFVGNEKGLGLEEAGQHCCLSTQRYWVTPAGVGVNPVHPD